MNVLIACEFSSIVRNEFRKRGHNAWSCDLLPCEGNSKYHIQDDVLNHLDGLYIDAKVIHGAVSAQKRPWDMMIAFPPCTHLAISGARWFKEKEKEQQEALEFIRKLLNAPIPRIALENPVGIISTKIRKPDQIIQPWQFGHPEAKKTCLWLKNLPLLKPTNILEKPACGYWNNQTPSGQNKLGPSEDRWKIRSRTYKQIAEQMAIQWDF